MSRAARQAVHALVREGDTASAFLVLHAARQSQSHSMETWRPKETTQMFRKPVSPRLCGHALIHALLRKGAQQKAFRLAQNMLEEDIRLHQKTLEAVVKGVLDSSGRRPVSKTEFLSRLKTILGTSQAAQLSPLMTAHAGTRCAIQIMQAARRRNYERTENMFSAVIKACLLQGELLAATLLFTAMVKEWTVREAQWRKDTESGNDAPNSANHRGAHQRIPDAGLLVSILSSIMEVLNRDGRRAADSPYGISFHAAIQALANLAWLLDWRQLMWPEVGGLIRALYSCPKSDHNVFILGANNRFLRVNASDYFNHVLTRLIHDPPRPESPTSHPFGVPSKSKVGEVHSHMNVMCRHSCNALLNYALRHQKSPDLANRILVYMREIGVELDTATFNTLLRAGTITRKSDLVEKALAALRKVPENDGLLKDALSPSPSSQDRTQKTPIPVPIPSIEDSLLSTNVPLKADSNTINSYITHLVATGRADVVAGILFYLVPELHVVDHPSWGTATPEEIRQFRRESRVECIRRIASYGPHVLVSLLSALRKAGQVGLVERVWILAKEAERASWVPGFCEDVEPWLLPVEAYTVMISTYADQVKKRWWKRLPMTESERAWVPRTNSRVKGWAKFILSTKRREKAHRFSAGKIGAMGIYNSMMTGAQSVYDELLKLRQTSLPSRSPILPEPDVKFFNAMLRITTRHPKMPPRNPYTTPSHWRQHIRFANWIYARLGKPRSYPNPMLETVVTDMKQAGLSIPLGLQYLLVGRSPNLLGVSPDTSPHHKSNRRRFHPFRIPVNKSRGLFLRRKAPHRSRRDHRISSKVI
ncbi:hypothetical protein VNI00_004820 [Paramarasmius palmivorus]|uniref:Pentatricopeptide repeat-containing protein n=1 Tax=Paramarasmius palmivorus TaxID=297713 RepID=A0AAW0DIP8_9AGAR